MWKKNRSASRSRRRRHLGGCSDAHAAVGARIRNKAIPAELERTDRKQQGASGGPDWWSKRQLVAAQRLNEFVVPTEADEDWRYARIDALDLGQVDLVAAEVQHEPVAPVLRDAALIDEIGDVSALIRTLDGRVVAFDTDSQLGTFGVRCGPSANFAEQPEGFGELIASAPDYFTTLADAFGTDAVIVVVPRGVRIERPIADRPRRNDTRSSDCHLPSLVRGYP